MMTIWRMTANDKSTTHLTRAVLGTVLSVAKQLQQDRALLLPKAVAVFIHSYAPGDDKTIENLHLEVGENTIKFGSRWLMSQLIMYLQPFMDYKCVVRRLGTLLYPRNGNLLKSLSLALHTPTCTCTCSNSNGEIGDYTQTQESLLTEAGNVINDIIHEETKRTSNDITDLTNFTLDESIENTNSLLWNFVCLCTRSKRERTRESNKDDAHTKTVRRYFIVCMMIFATNPSFNTLLHHLVADTVEVCGGSRRLIRILNRLGVCVSTDTHDRLVTYLAEDQRERSVWSELSQDKFTLASIDNIDFFAKSCSCLLWRSVQKLSWNYHPDCATT